MPVLVPQTFTTQVIITYCSCCTLRKRAIKGLEQVYKPEYTILQNAECYISTLQQLQYNKLRSSKSSYES